MRAALPLHRPLFSKFMKLTLSAGTRILYRDDEDRSRLISATVLERIEDCDWYEIREDGVTDDTPWIHEDLIAQYVDESGEWHEMEHNLKGVCI